MITIGGRKIFYESGRRNISSRLQTLTNGAVFIERVGRVVTVNFDTVTFSDNGTTTMSAAVPEGFRPNETLLQKLMVQTDGSKGWRISVSSAGNVSLYYYQTDSYLRGYFSYICADALPTTLPGIPA